MTGRRMSGRRTAWVSGGGGSNSGTAGLGDDGADGGCGGIARASAAATAAAAAHSSATPRSCTIEALSKTLIKASRWPYNTEHDLP